MWLTFQVDIHINNFERVDPAMAYATRTNRKRRSTKYTEDKPKHVSRNYHVTPQTAYNVAKLAMMMKTSEGRVIDKLVRNCMVSEETFNELKNSKK